MQSDFNNMQVGDYVMIVASIELEDNAKLYSRTETEWVFITDFSGATGIQGEQGIQGKQGIQGERGIGISKLNVRDGYLYVTLTDNTSQNAGPIITDEVKQWIINEITNNAQSKFNAYYNEKVTDFDEHAETKINEYNQNVESLTNRMTELETENTILKNQIPKGQAEGNLIHLKDSSDMEMNWKIKGGHRQATREGYNLLDFNVAQDSKVTVNEDGTITINGEGGFAIKFKKFEYKKGVTYKTKATLVSETYTSSDPNHIGIMTPYGNNEWLANNIFRTYISLEDKVRSGMWVGANCVFNNATFEIYSYEGTDDKSFEQYGVSPSPEYPSEVKTVGSNVNILNIPDIEETERNGIKYSVKNGILRLKGTASAGFDINSSSNIQIKKGKYTHSSNYIQKGLYVSFDNLRSTMLSTQNGRKCSFELTEDKLYSKYFIWIDKGTVLNDVEIRLKLEEGEIATPWSPYGMGSVEIDVVNDNLFGKPLLNYAISGNSSDGFLVENNSNGVTYIAKLKNNLNYYIKKNNNVGNRFRIVLFSDYPVSTNHSKNVKELTTNVDLTEYGFNSDKYNYVAFTVNVNSELNEDCLVKLEQNTKATPYIEHQSQKQIIPIQQEMLEGDYIEEVEHHEWGKIVLTGDEEITLVSGSNGVNQFNTKVQDLLISESNNYFNNVISNYWGYINYWNNSWLVDNVALQVAGLSLIRMQTSLYSTVEQFKTWLKQKYDEGNPVIVYYKLAEPINLELTAEQKAIRGNKLKTYKNITNISVDNELAKTEVKYYKDLTTMMNNLANASIGGN